MALSFHTGCSMESGFSKTVDGNNHLSGFSYDASGNTLNDGVNPYVWNAESQLKTGNGTNYLYDGDGRRVSKVGSKLYWYDGGGEMLAETNTSGAVTAEYVFFGGKRIAMLPAGGNATYYVEDLLGTSRVMTTNTGVVCYDADFYPYGGERSYTNACPQNYKFEGKERDTETGNDDFDARYYSNRFGRWLSADWSAVPAPVPYANFTNPQTLNLYGMVADDPESFADLDGHEITRSSTSTCTGNSCTYTTTTTARIIMPDSQLNGQSVTQVYSVKTVLTVNSDGSQSETSTATNAYFSNEAGHEGQYLGGTQETDSVQRSPSGTAINTSDKTVSNLDVKTAMAAVGTDYFSVAQRMAAKPMESAYFARQVGRDARTHPGKYAFYAVEVAATLTPLPEAYAAYEGVKAAIDVVVSAAHLAWDLNHE